MFRPWQIKAIKCCSYLESVRWAHVCGLNTRLLQWSSVCRQCWIQHCVTRSSELSPVLWRECSAISRGFLRWFQRPLDLRRSPRWRTPGHCCHSDSRSWQRSFSPFRAPWWKSHRDVRLSKMKVIGKIAWGFLPCREAAGRFSARVAWNELSCNCMERCSCILVFRQTLPWLRCLIPPLMEKNKRTAHARSIRLPELGCFKKHFIICQSVSAVRLLYLTLYNGDILLKILYCLNKMWNTNVNTVMPNDTK